MGAWFFALVLLGGRQRSNGLARPPLGRAS